VEGRESRPGLAERVLREVLSTPALKELVMLQLRDIKPENASGIARTLIWGDPALSMSLVSALPGALNWAAEFLLELARQLDSLPEPLLADLAGVAGSGLDLERLRRLRDTCLSLAGKLLAGQGGPEERARRLAAAINRSATSLDRLASLLEERRADLSAYASVLRKEVDWKRLAGSARHLLSILISAVRSDLAATEPARRRMRKKIVLAAIGLALILRAARKLLR